MVCVPGVMFVAGQTNRMSRVEWSEVVEGCNTTTSGYVMASCGLQVA